MSDLDARIRGWVDERNASIEPVTADEVVDRARTGPMVLEPQQPRSHHRAFATAAAIALVGLAAATVLVLTRENTQDVVTDTDESFERLASIIPDDLGGGSATLADYEGERREAGLRRPAPAEPLAQQDAYLDDLMRRRRWLPLGPPEMNHVTSHELRGGVRDELGIEPAQVLLAATWGDPPNTVSAFVGQFDEQLVDRAARGLPEPWATAMTIRGHRGVRYYSWFPDFETDPARALLTDAVGMSRRVALVDDHLILTRSTAAMEATIDAILDGRRSSIGDLAREAGQQNGMWINRTVGVEGASAFTIQTGREIAPERADPWTIHVAITDDPHRVRDELRWIVTAAAEQGGWENQWRDQVTVEVDGRVVTITIPNRGEMRAVLTDIVAQLAEALAGGPIDSARPEPAAEVPSWGGR